MQIHTFIGKAIRDLAEAGITVQLVSKTRLLSNNQPFAGYFDETTSMLEVATDKPEIEWFSIFVHEYCHFLQYEDGVFAAYKPDVWADFTAWHQKTRRLPKDQAKKYCRIIQLVELDAERRSVELIKRHDLPIDLDTYIKGANSYVWSYNMVLKHRQWPKKTPITEPEILELCPTELIAAPTVRMPKGYEKKYLELCK